MKMLIELGIPANFLAIPDQLIKRGTHTPSMIYSGITEIASFSTESPWPDTVNTFTALVSPIPLQLECI